MRKQGISRFKHVAERLKKARIETGLSQKEVSDSLGYTTPQFVSNWERGLCSPPVASLKRLCRLYSLDAEEVFRMVLTGVEVSMRREFQGGKAI